MALPNSFEKATKDAEALAERCNKEIGGNWKARVRENLDWYWYVYQEETNIFIDYNGKHYTVGLNGGIYIEISTHYQVFNTPKEAYDAQVKAIKTEADRWNTLLDDIQKANSTIQ